jgi:trans-aconitate 2-methyltransferase
VTVWDPAIYNRYKAYRERPALDLLLRLPQDLAPREIWDLGCGAGEQAAVLKLRHPGARVRGLDSSAEMLAEARGRNAEVEWIEGDIAGFAPDTPPDLIFTNAALQWLPDHDDLIPRLVRTLAAGGVFACQMPETFDTSWHRLLRETAADGGWASRLAGVRGVRPVAPPEAYYDMVAPICGEVDIWSTVYLHVLEGDDPVVEWMQGTGLRPYLQALPDGDERLRFLDAYRARIASAFPARSDGVTLFPFPRLFILARR